MVLQGKASSAVIVSLVFATFSLPALANDSLFLSEAYYDNIGSGHTSLRRVDLQTGQVTVLLAGSGGNVGPSPINFLPTGVAVDPVHGKMYYSDVNSDKIGRMNFDGSGRVDVLSGLADPWDIALDVAAGKMYWANHGTDKIQRANLDGSNVENVITS